MSWQAGGETQPPRQPLMHIRVKPTNIICRLQLQINQSTLGVQPLIPLFSAFTENGNLIFDMTGFIDFESVSPRNLSTDCMLWTIYVGCFQVQPASCQNR